jgi:Homeodomain-like domain
MVVGHAGTGPGWWLLIGDNGAMTSDDEPRAEVVRLHRAGWSIGAIAERLGLSKSRVGRIVVAAAEEDDDLTDDEIARRDAEPDDDYPPPPPFRFVGVELVIVEQPGCDPEPAEQLRYLDGGKRPCSELDIYRARMALEEAGRYGESDAISADLARQYAEAGYRWLLDPAAQRWRLVQRV